MYHRTKKALLVIAVCILVLAPTASAAGYSKTGKSGQVYTWSCGHC